MKVKKYLSLLLAVVMIASVFSTTAFASESELPVNEVIIGGDSLEYRAPNPPTLFYNLGGSGQYTATLIDLAANRGSYTKYYFATSTGEIYLKFDLERSGTSTNKNRELIIYVHPKQVASKLNHAQIGMYFIYLGAVVGSSGLISSNATASLISRDTVPDAESFNPNRSLSELLVNCSPCTCLIQACK